MTDDPSLYFASLTIPPESSPQLTHPSKTQPAEIRAFNSRSCLGSNRLKQQLTWAHISLASRKDQGILSPNRHEILEVFYSDIFKGMMSAGHMVAADLKVYYPLCLSGSAFNALSDHKCLRQKWKLFWEIIHKIQIKMEVFTIRTFKSIWINIWFHISKFL